MAPKKKVMKDLWDAEEGTKAIVTPTALRVDSGKWFIDAEMRPNEQAGVRTRAYKDTAKPNKRAAVAIPHPSQSYNPDDRNHQAALQAVAVSLEKKRKAHENFVKKITHTGPRIKSALVDDQTWEESVNDGAVARQEKALIKNRGRTKRTTKLKVKKVVKDSIRRSKRHMRHPDRAAAVGDLDEIADIKEAVDKKVKRMANKAKRKIQARKDGLETKSFGRYHFTPQLLDVATTDKLVGCLRHIAANTASHAAVDRVKSLEERNVIPARMRHTFNKRKMLKVKGQVMIKREPMGRMPDPDDHTLPEKN